MKKCIVNQNLSSVTKLSSLLLITSMLIACGGGSDSSSSNQSDPKANVKPDPKPDPKPEIQYIKLSGTINTIGDILSQSNVKIEAKCLNSSGFRNIVNTNMYGDWTGEIDKTQLPCKVRAISNNEIYYSYITKNNELVNINPITSFVIANASKQTVEDWYQSSSIFVSGDLEKAIDQIKQELKLKKYIIDESVNLLSNDTSKNNSSYYKTLDELKESINKSTAFNGYSELLKMIGEGKYSAIPYAIEDYARLNIDYSACVGTEYQGSTKLLTHCASSLLPDFKSSKLVQKNNSICDIQKNGDELTFKSGQNEYKVKINKEASDKITDRYPVMNTLLLAEGSNRVELVFQYDLLTIAAAYQVDSQGKSIGVISCQ